MKIKRKGLTLNVFEDYGESPREYKNNFGKMICFHKRYSLGDKHDFKGPDEFDEWRENNQDKIGYILPLYMLDHSGLTISTTPFHDPWDSGQIGYIYGDRADALKYGLDPLDDDELEMELQEEVEEYDRWISGNPPCYAFELTDEDDNTIHCQGIFECEDLKSMLENMKSNVDKQYHFIFDALYRKENENCL